MSLKLIRVLTRVIARSNSMDEISSRKRKIWLAAFGIFVMLFVMIPVILMTGFFTYSVTGVLLDLGRGDFGIKLIYAVVSVFTVVFGMNIVMNEFYFEDDLVYLLPMPIKSAELALSRFIAVFIAENLMQFAIVIAAVAGFGIASGISPLTWVLSLLGGLFLPLVPMCSIAVISMLIMNFTGFIRKRATVRKISFAVTLAVIAISGAMLLKIDVEELVYYVAGAKSTGLEFLDLIDYIFPQVEFLATYMAEGTVWKFIDYITVNIWAVVILVVTSHFLYKKSVIRLMSTGSEGSDVRISLRDRDIALARSPFASLLVKELKTLIRTPAFLSNCVASNYIWPFFVPVLMMVFHISMARDELALYVSSEGRTLYITIGVLVITLVNASMNCLGSDAFSREGKGFDYIKLIPVPFKLQWNAKALANLIFTWTGTLPFFLFFLSYAGLDICLILVNLIMSALAGFMVIYLGMFLDAMNPKLVWLDALSALRENYNTVFAMGIVIVFAIIMGFVMYLAGKALGTAASGLICTAVLVIADIALYMLSMNKGIDLIKSVGE